MGLLQPKTGNVANCHLHYFLVENNLGVGIIITFMIMKKKIEKKHPAPHILCITVVRMIAAHPLWCYIQQLLK